MDKQKKKERWLKGIFKAEQVEQTNESIRVCVVGRNEQRERERERERERKKEGEKE